MWGSIRLCFDVITYHAAYDAAGHSSLLLLLLLPHLLLMLYLLLTVHPLLPTPPRQEFLCLVWIGTIFPWTSLLWAPTELVAA